MQIVLFLLHKYPFDYVVICKPSGDPHCQPDLLNIIAHGVGIRIARKEGRTNGSGPRTGIYFYNGIPLGFMYL